MCKILIAEDEVWISALIRSIIQKNCAHAEIVGEAPNGRKALEMIGALRPDIVLADINMPVMTGLQVIEEAKKAGFGGKFIIISGYKDFSYVQQALRIGVEDYLLKPIDDEKLCALIEKTAQKITVETTTLQQNTRNDALLKAQFLSRLLSGAKLSISACNDAFGLHFAPGKFRCAIIKFVHRSLDHSYLIAESLTEITARSRASFRERLVPLCTEAFSIQQGSFLIVFLNYPAEALGQVQQILTELFDELLADCAAHSIQTTMGISDVCGDFSLLPDAYRQAQAAVASRTSLGSGKIIPFTAETKSRGETFSSLALTDRDLTALNRALRSSSPAELTGWFNSRFDCYVQQNHIVENETFLLLDAVSTLLNAVFDTVHALPTRVEINRSALLDQLEIHPTVGELRTHIDTLLQELKEKIDQQLNAADATISRASEYINAHLSDAITLEDVARAVYLTPSYLSEYFKSKTGTNFKDYLLQRRMERATDLLRQGNIRIQDIAVQCGYTDFKHFCKVFKKSIGVTPTEFRRIYG